jgi:hypothetical protein
MGAKTNRPEYAYRIALLIKAESLLSQQIMYVGRTDSTTPMPPHSWDGLVLPGPVAVRTPRTPLPLCRPRCRP